MKYPKKVLNAADKMVEFANGDYWNEAVRQYNQELFESNNFTLAQIGLINDIARNKINGRA